MTSDQIDTHSSESIARTPFEARPMNSRCRVTGRELLKEPEVDP